MNNKYEVKIAKVEIADGAINARVKRNIESTIPAGALQQAYGDQIVKTDFFRKGETSDGKEFTMYDAQFKDGYTARVTVTETFKAPAESQSGKVAEGTAKPKAARKARAASSAAAKPSDLADCTAAIFLSDRGAKGEWSHCIRKEKEKGSGRCFQHGKFAFPVGTPKAALPFTAEAIAKGVDKLYAPVAEPAAKKARKPKSAPAELTLG